MQYMYHQIAFIKSFIKGIHGNGADSLQKDNVEQFTRTASHVMVHWFVHPHDVICLIDIREHTRKKSMERLFYSLRFGQGLH